MWYEKIKNLVRNFFFEGLFTLLPLTITFWVLRFLYKTSVQLLAPLRHWEPEWLQLIPGSEFLLVGFFILFVGVLGHFLIINPILHYFEKIIHKIPLVRIVYGSIKTMVEFFDVPRHPEFKRKVVLISYPDSSTHKVAFLLGQADDFGEMINKNQDEKIMKVFMPTSHITTGFTLFIPESRIILTDISFEEAIKMMVSCGVIHPKKIKNALDNVAP
jgi:uncharacterized membrane protein